MIASGIVRSLVLSGVLALSIAAPAAAQQPVCAQLDDAEVRARTDVLMRAVRREEPAVRRWWSSFALLHSVMAAGAAIIAASAQDEGQRNEMLVGVTSSALGLATLVIFTPPLLGAGDALRAQPADTPEERLHRLRMAERTLAKAAAGTEFLRSWVPASLTTLYVSAAASTLLLAFERPQGAIIHSIGGAVLGLGRVLLHPTGARDRWRRYLRAHPDADCQPAPETASLEPRARLVGYGLGLGLRVDF